MRKYTVIAKGFLAEFYVRDQKLCKTSPNICRFTGKDPCKLFDWLDSMFPDSYHVTPTEVRE